MEFYVSSGLADVILYKDIGNDARELNQSNWEDRKEVGRWKEELMVWIGIGRGLKIRNKEGREVNFSLSNRDWVDVQPF